MASSSDPEARAALKAKFVEFQHTRDRKLRNELIEAHRLLAAHFARRYSNRGEPFDDLLQVAYLGTLKAVERFDPDRNVEFSTFAAATIDGELKRHFRDKTWSVRVPRRTQELHLRLPAATNQLSQQLRRAPTLDELADELDASQDEVLQAMEAAGAYRSASLDARSSGERDTPALERSLGSVDENFDLAEHRVIVDELLATLPERERMIVELRFFDELTQSEIADRIGVSQMHVSRLLARTLQGLRSRLAEDTLA
ncbi:MAG TPA: SigB/SigF/SigG family RNA polymerase sigma factor [Acidimicrobiia bacterium]|jgi:RNA polymerase sigma-B factor